MSCMMPIDCPAVVATSIHQSSMSSRGGYEPPTQQTKISMTTLPAYSSARMPGLPQADVAQGPEQDAGLRQTRSELTASATQDGGHVARLAGKKQRRERASGADRRGQIARLRLLAPLPFLRASLQTLSASGPALCLRSPAISWKGQRLGLTAAPSRSH